MIRKMGMSRVLWVLCASGFVIVLYTGSVNASRFQAPPAAGLEVLFVNFSCFVEGFPGSVPNSNLTFNGSGDIAGQTGSLFVSGIQESGPTCAEVAGRVQDAVPQQNCGTPVVRAGGDNASFNAFCQGERDELIAIISGISRALVGQ